MWIEGTIALTRLPESREYAANLYSNPPRFGAHDDAEDGSQPHGRPRQGSKHNLCVICLSNAPPHHVRLSNIKHMDVSCRHEFGSKAEKEFEKSYGELIDYSRGRAVYHVAHPGY